MASEVISEYIISWRERAPVSLADVCYAHTECAYAVPT